MSSQPPPASTGMKDWHLIFAIIGVIVAVVGILVTVILATGGKSSDTAGQPSSSTSTLTHSPSQMIPTPTPSPVVVSQAPASEAPSPETTQAAPPVLPWKINRPDTATVKMCQAFSGTGNLPDGLYFWIVVRSNPEDGRKYYFQDARMDDPSPGHWTAEKVTVGGKSEEEWKQKMEYQIIAVTVTPALNDRINDGDFDGGTSSLPNGADPKTKITVTAGKPRTECQW
jgi:hypothetical protein